MKKALGCLAFGVLAGFLVGWGVSEIGKTQRERELLDYARTTASSRQPFSVLLVPERATTDQPEGLWLRVDSRGWFVNLAGHIAKDPSHLPPTFTLSKTDRWGIDVIHLTLEEGEGETSVEGLVGRQSSIDG